MAAKGRTPGRKIAGVGDEAVEAKTGRTWEAWLKVLDRAGARKMAHKAIARYLHEEHGVSGWWSQMVTVGYEQERGLRKKHEKADGFAASASKTIGVPVSALYRAWHDARRRARWLPEANLTVRTKTPDKSMRFTWIDGKSSVNVYFYEKGESKSQVAIDHAKLRSERDVPKMKAYWGEALVRLKEVLEA